MRVKKISRDAYQAKNVADFASRRFDSIYLGGTPSGTLFRGHAFWDMRRQGMPEVKHEFYSSMTSSKTFVLKQESPNYLLPIPLSETEYNDGMTNNSRETIVGN